METKFKQKCLKELKLNSGNYYYYSLKELSGQFPDINRLPFSLKVLLENLIRYEDKSSVSSENISSLAQMATKKNNEMEIAFRPARVLMQDFTGVPAVVDLAAMRDAMVKLENDPKKINPLSPVDLVIDHSVMVDFSGDPDAFKKNVELEFNRNNERYSFLKWGSKAFNNFRVVPPGTGICHQVNLEYLAKTIWTNNEEGKTFAFPDTLVGTDSHTTMVNSLAVLGWGVGGIEAEAAMLGQPISMLVPEVVGFKLTGELQEGITATDLVLRIVEILRAKGVVGKFVEFFGSGLNNLSLADRSTISNMAPEYGATCGFFPIDIETINYLKFTGREIETLELVEAYAKAQGMWRDINTKDPIFSSTLELDLTEIKPSLAGPKRPQDRVLVSELKENFMSTLDETSNRKEIKTSELNSTKLSDGDIGIAAITSCTNTSNPGVLIAAGLLAKKAFELGLRVKPWVKTSLAPGSKVVTDYLDGSGLQKYLDELGFNLVGYGCTTCIGNSGSLSHNITNLIETNDLLVTSVLSGNRNFEGRISPHIKANYLASPPLVVAYAIVGSVLINLDTDPLGYDEKNNPIYLKDIWPSNKEVSDVISAVITPEMYREQYSSVFDGGKDWENIKSVDNLTYNWDSTSTYVQNPPYFENMKNEPEKIKDILGARALAILGDSITTDHISPAGSILKQAPAGKYLSDRQVREDDYNSYGSRRGNHEVMMRGTFANNRLTNAMVHGVKGGITKHQPSQNEMSIYDAAMLYSKNDTPLIVFGGKEYGTGSSRDWAAKGTRLLGVKAVIAESFERIHRSNLIGMGVLPLQFLNNYSHEKLKLIGNELFDIIGLEDNLSPKINVLLKVQRVNGDTENIELLCRIDTDGEAEYYLNGGILHYVLRQLAA